jgi:general secretion pathway protein D
VAQDGKKLAIGGLVREEESIEESKVPLLGDIPILGFFFKKYISKIERKEIVMLIVPHIMIAAGEAETVSDKTMKGLSEHPYLKHDKEKLLIYDEQTGKLRSTTGPSFAEGIFFYQ